MLKPIKKIIDEEQHDHSHVILTVINWQSAFPSVPQKIKQPPKIGVVLLEYLDFFPSLP